jgi:hypothetical protein
MKYYSDHLCVLVEAAVVLFHEIHPPSYEDYEASPQIQVFNLQ